jgi:hypothetical protein
MVAGSLTAATAGGGGSNASGGGGSSDAKVDRSIRVARGSALLAYDTPVQAYTNKTCAIDLSAIVTGTMLNNVNGCGVRVSFSNPMEKRAVGDGWATWGSPPDTEDASPEVLVSSVEEVTLRYSVRGRRIGVEVEPNDFAVRRVKATFLRKNGTVIGKIVRQVDGNGGALLFAGKSISPQKRDKIRSLVIKVKGDTFAIAQIRVS